MIFNFDQIYIKNIIYIKWIEVNVMCGAYGLSVKTIKDIIYRFDVEIEDDNVEGFRPRWNIRPGQNNPVIINHEKNHIEMMCWGLLPHFAHDEHYKHKPINARAETIDELPTFRHPFNRTRCIIPATGFYEPDKINFSREPFPWHYFTMTDSSIFAFAGLFDIWHDKNSEKEIHSYTIITTTPNAVVGKYHDRMPVILGKEDEDTWLNPDTEVGQLLPLLKPYNTDEMVEWEVGAAARDPKNDYEEVIEPHKSTRQRTLF
jgi:putative SOS response-associated peptidase YedK